MTLSQDTATLEHALVLHSNSDFQSSVIHGDFSNHYVTDYREKEQCPKSATVLKLYTKSKPS